VIEIDGVHADADLLNESQRRGRVHGLRGDGLEHVEQHVGTPKQLPEQLIVGLRAGAYLQPPRRQTLDPGAQGRTACIVEDGAHGGLNPPVFQSEGPW
jgi:hypothetical protein